MSVAIVGRLNEGTHPTRPAIRTVEDFGVNFDPIDDVGGNVTLLPTAAKPRPDAELEVVYSYKCRHGHFLVDDKKDRVECGLCHEMLNPMWVLLQIAHDDSRLRDRWSHMK